jgi:hypothetical protein
MQTSLRRPFNHASVGPQPYSGQALGSSSLHFITQYSWRLSALSTTSPHARRQCPFQATFSPPPCRLFRKSPNLSYARRLESGQDSPPQQESPALRGRLGTFVPISRCSAMQASRRPRERAEPIAAHGVGRHVVGGHRGPGPGPGAGIGILQDGGLDSLSADSPLHHGHRTLRRKAGLWKWYKARVAALFGPLE